MTPEGKVKKETRAALDALGAWSFMPQGGAFGKGGIPDFIGCYQGKFFGIETKSQAGRLTPLQAKAIEGIKAAGGSAGVIKPSAISTHQQVLNILEKNE